MQSIQKLKRNLARRIEVVIENSDDPLAAMDEIAEVAVRRGLIDSNALPRRDSPEEFVMDLWTDNPLTLDRLSLASQEHRIDPINVKELPDVLDVIP